MAPAPTDPTRMQSSIEPLKLSCIKKPAEYARSILSIAVICSPFDLKLEHHRAYADVQYS